MLKKSITQQGKKEWFKCQKAIVSASGSKTGW